MLVIFLFVAVFASLVRSMVIRGESLQGRAIEQWYRDIPLRAERGEILDANGTLLAGTVTTYTIYLRPVSCTNKEQTASILSKKLSLSYANIYAKLNSKISEITVKKRVDKSTVMDILSLGATGVFVSRDIQRVYPYSDFLTQVMGFTNIDCKGQTGLESYYNNYLAGRDGYVYTPSDLVGRELKGDATYYVEGTKGATLTLTIQKNIQDALENAIESCALNTQAKSVSAIVMDPNTGAILGMGTTPSFDLNAVPRDDVGTLMKLSRIGLVSDVFEPGSTFKMVTAAIGLDSGKITTAYRSYCNGALIVDGQRIKCWRTKGHGSQSFSEGVASSCNCLFMNIALSVGVDTFYDGIGSFGITQKTGIDLMGEASGLVIPRNSVKTVDLARIGFGQAIAMTPIELLRACSAVINGGRLVTPYLCSSIVAADGTLLHKGGSSIAPSVIKESTSATMREVLETVVLSGSGKGAQVEGIRVGGKTGTAQKYENGAIARGKYISTFVGFAPVESPSYIALIVVDEPVGAYYGGLVAAPYIGQIFKSLF